VDHHTVPLTVERNVLFLRTEPFLRQFPPVLFFNPPPFSAAPEITNYLEEEMEDVSFDFFPPLAEPVPLRGNLISHCPYMRRRSASPVKTIPPSAAFPKVHEDLLTRSFPRRPPLKYPPGLKDSFFLRPHPPEATRRFPDCSWTSYTLFHSSRSFFFPRRHRLSSLGRGRNALR